MSRFQIQSMAKITLPEDLMLNSPDTIKVLTQLQTREPPRPPPGQGCDKNLKMLKIFFKFLSMFSFILSIGIQCGSGACHKYADCHYDFGNQDFSCRCVPGFQGDGYGSCNRAPSM